MRQWFERLLEQLNTGVTGSADRFAAIGLIEGALSLDKGEVTDKGSLNQRAIIKERAGLVEALYLASAGPTEFLVYRLASLEKN